MKRKRGRKGVLGARHGRHDPDKVLVGGFFKPEVKALLQLTAAACDEDTCATIQRGILQVATAHGIVKNGRVADEYADEHRALAATIRDNLTKRRERNSKK